ncbi:3-deoxy-D-manno-octulosonic acid transferase [Leptospira ilyithenensis]|uniref:3-deoxy-D-manno-octulosonic acid transferase n=1 Tax=Leptospira ilyithenensis TaxID=2484901 RepID=A0A4R9LQW3_9LEPT|nr:glycosyltransferase N-terminal domain-containing protein [Leptospira ilyithenensis]TGN11911.1 3-deoxy-D-manno-octulosonic acid transferase [Leptospira ilyithenensis]
MAYFLYNLILILLYLPFLIVVFLFPKGRMLLAKRKKSLTELLNSDKDPQRKTVWLHAASVGELDQARALAGEIKRQNPSLFIIQSVYSDSVTDKQTIDPNFDRSFILPLDFPFAYDSLFKKFRPEKLIILAWDTWPNLLKTANKYNCKSYLACASLSSGSGRKKGFVHSLTKASFQYLEGIYPSHPIIAEEFKTLAPDHKIETLGDTRFESVLHRIESGTPPERFQTFLKKYKTEIADQKPILLGSTYPVCESYFSDFLFHWSEQNHPLPTFWIFPHKWEENRMQSFRSKLESITTVKTFSELMDRSSEYPKIVLVDELGILAFAYQFAKFAYVGGAFHHRVHNTIEPAAFALSLVTGLKISNAPEAIVMQKLGGLIACNHKEEYISAFKKLILNPNLAEELGAKNRNFVLENKGASGKIYSRVFSNDPN